MSGQKLSSAKKAFFGHPSQLSTLFYIGLWERFSFYDMQGILLIYLYCTTSQGSLGMDKALADDIVDTYGGGVYPSTILGAWLADRIWGAECTPFIAGIVVMTDHILLAVISDLMGLLLGLVFVMLGSDGVKSSAGSMVGSLYERENLYELRDVGSSIFYVSINIGGLLGLLLTGTLQDRMDSHYGSGAAAVDTASGLLWYSRGRKNLPHTPVPNPLRPGKVQTAATVGVLLVLVLGSATVSGALTPENFSRWLPGVVIATVVTYFVHLLGSSHAEAANKRYIVAYIPLFLTIYMFWAIWLQVYIVAMVYFDETVDRTFFSFTVPISREDSVQAVWVVLFFGVMAAVWTKMDKRQLRTLLKFALAMLVTGASYSSFISYISPEVPTPTIILMLILLATMIGELMPSPISLPFPTRIAPSMSKTRMVVLNFSTLPIGFTLGGVLFKDYYNTRLPSDFYWMLVITGAVTCGTLLILTPVLSRMLKGVDWFLHLNGYDVRGPSKNNLFQTASCFIENWKEGGFGA